MQHLRFDNTHFITDAWGWTSQRRRGGRILWVWGFYKRFWSKLWRCWRRKTENLWKAVPYEGLQQYGIRMLCIILSMVYQSTPDISHHDTSFHSCYQLTVCHPTNTDLGMLVAMVWICLWAWHLFWSVDSDLVDCWMLGLWLCRSCATNEYVWVTPMFWPRHFSEGLSDITITI